jgi:hypothetical protein
MVEKEYMLCMQTQQRQLKDCYIKLIYTTSLVLIALFYDVGVSIKNVTTQARYDFNDCVIFKTFSV